MIFTQFIKFDHPIIIPHYYLNIQKIFYHEIKNVYIWTQVITNTLL